MLRICLLFQAVTRETLDFQSPTANPALADSVLLPTSLPVYLLESGDPTVSQQIVSWMEEMFIVEGKT